MKQEFIDYELHLQMYNDALWRHGEAHAKHELGELKKPDGYDEYKVSQNPDNQIIETKKDGFSYVDFINRLEMAEKELNAEKGLLFDADGIPQYLTADDHYNGIENPEWLKKYAKAKFKPATYKTIENKPAQNEKLGINYDEDGIPEYPNAECYHFGEVNPEWLKKHEK